MAKNEATFQTRMTKYMKEFWKEGSCAMELKFARGSRMSFHQIKPHQLVALRLSSNKKIVWKIEDSGYLQKPFDMFVLEKVPSYLAIMFEVEKSSFYLLSIEQIDGLIFAGNKSITLDDCKRLGRKFDL